MRVFPSLFGRTARKTPRTPLSHRRITDSASHQVRPHQSGANADWATFRAQKAAQQNVFWRELGIAVFAMLGACSLGALLALVLVFKLSS